MLHAVVGRRDARERKRRGEGDFQNALIPLRMALPSVRGPCKKKQEQRQWRKGGASSDQV